MELFLKQLKAAVKMWVQDLLRIVKYVGVFIIFFNPLTILFTTWYLHHRWNYETETWDYVGSPKDDVGILAQVLCATYLLSLTIFLLWLWN